MTENSFPPEVLALGQHPVNTTNQSFASLGLSEPILKCIDYLGFKHPTPIQSAVIPISLTGQDVVGLAQTGSGKTAAFSLPLAERLTHGHGLRGLIISPTREIALQTKSFLDVFGKHHHLQTVCLIGGVKMGPQLTELRKKIDIIVATPGRLLDHIERKTVDVGHIEELVLDEADHMLDMGFLPQVNAILKHLPKNRHTMMFSATMPEPIERLARNFLNNPARVDILPTGKAAEGITHRLYLVDRENKQNCLLALLQQELGSTLIFTRMKIDADWVTKMLQRENHKVAKIHSDLSQSERTAALDDFKKGEVRVLVATDIASRGIDVPGIQHVVNFDLPETVDEYIHRAGRTARANAQGLVSSIGTWMDRAMVKDIEKILGKEIPRCTVPGVPPFVEIVVKPSLRRRR